MYLFHYNTQVDVRKFHLRERREMRNPIRTRWGKDVAHQLIEKGCFVIDLAKKTGVRPTVISSLMYGSYTGDDFEQAVEAINVELGTQGKPPKLNEKWCTATKRAMILDENKGRKMSYEELAQSVGYSRDRVERVVNGRAIDKEVSDAISKKLNIGCSAILYE